MKRSSLLILVFLISSTLLYSQDTTSSTILGTKYSLSYDAAKELFEICQVKDKSSKCYKESIAKTSEFEFVNALSSNLKTQVNKFTFNILGQDKTLQDFKTIDYTKVTVYIDSLNLATIGKEIPVKFKDEPEGFPEFKIKKANDSIYELSQKELLKSSITIKFNDVVTTKSDEFKTELQKELVKIKDGIAKHFVPKIKKQFDDLLEELYTESISKNESYSFLTSQKLKDTDSTSASFNFLLLINDQIHLKVYKSTETKDDASKYGAFDISTSENEFVNGMITQHNAFEDTALNRQTLGKVYHMITTKKESKIVADTKQQFDNDLQSEIDKQVNAKTTYSGKMALNRKVPLYHRKIKYEKVVDSNGNETGDSTIVYTRNWYLKKTPKYTLKPVKKSELELIVDSVNVHFFNNRADNISIVGRLSKDSNTKTRVLTNRLYSLPLRELNNRSQTNSFFHEDGTEYTYYYDDVLDYLPYNKYNYAIKNGEIKVKADQPTKVKERKIGDYFTGIFFSDFLGLNTNNSNSLIVAEGRIRIPFNLRNIKRVTWFDNVTAYASVNLFSGFENSSRKVTLDDSSDPDDTSDTNAALFTTNNFNLLNNNNIDAGIHITPYTFEWKGASTFVHLRYGLRFLRTGIEYNLRTQDSTGTTSNELKGFQVFSIGQEADINFEIRPQSSVGADLSIGLNWFRANGTNKNDIDFSTTNNAPNLKAVANIYSLTNSDESNAGVYFRIGGHYNLGNYKVFPQLMVGYATNLSSFVNKVKKEKK
ncbi:hypothetical protein [Psychroserpens sp. MEBiC05023]